MIQLLVFRHAKAVRDDPRGDKSRALEGRGRKAAVFMGGWLRDQGFLPDLALVSDARRTRETFELASAQFETPVPAQFEPSMYNASEDTLLAVLRRAEPRARRVLMIGHNPGLADFAALLAGAGERAALRRIHLKFPTAALAILSFQMESWSEVDWKDARLERFVTPASLTGAPETD
jgi:phosphohistidine phosphatase